MLRDPFVRGLVAGIAFGSAVTALFAFVSGLVPPDPGTVGAVTMHLHYGSGG